MPRWRSADATGVRRARRLKAFRIRSTLWAPLRTAFKGRGSSAMAVKWTCFDCDWDNDVSLLVCEMCDTARSLSCVARGDRSDASKVKAKQRELLRLQELQEARAEADRLHKEEEQGLKRLAEQWAEQRLTRLRQELKSIRAMPASTRRPGEKLKLPGGLLGATTGVTGVLLLDS